MKNQSKDQVVFELEQLLDALIQEHRRGAAGTKLANAHMYLDRYMHGLLEAGTLTERQLLDIVRERRRRSDGPATTAIFDWVRDAEAA